MYKLGIIGYPLGHSISAVIQKAGWESIGETGQYDVLETPPEDLVSRIKYLKTNGYDGFNVTIPLKVPVSLFLDSIDESANIAGCANTIKITPDRNLHGYNTDVYGFKAAIPESFDLKGKNVSILGTGGAARAATIGLIERGVTEIDYFSRNILNSSEMVNSMRNSFPHITFNNFQIQMIRDLSETSMLVNATPVGMRGFAMDAMPINKEDLMNLNKNTIVYDVIYNPTKTLLLQSAEQLGLKTISGLDMLIHQGARAIEIWTGKKPDVKMMKIAALESLT